MWVALHNEQQHDTFNSLIKALEYRISEHYDGWVLRDMAEEEAVNIQIYYPLVILQEDLYSASLENKSISLRKAKHVQFRKEIFLPRENKVETYQIDVITEGYLPDYLKIINTEIGKIKKIFQRHRSDILTSIEKIVEEAKKLKNPNSYRECLEF